MFSPEPQELAGIPVKSVVKLYFQDDLENKMPNNSVNRSETSEIVDSCDVIEFI
jgi:hypothetical protein